MEESRSHNRIRSRRIMAGCLVYLIEIVIIAFVAACCMALVSCHASQKSLEAVHDASADTSAVITSHNVHDATTSSSLSVDTSDEGEDIHEHIVTFTDSLGQTTTTTDRTIHRRKSSLLANQQQTDTSHSESNDSLNIRGHWEENDSIHSESQSSSIPPTPFRLPFPLSLPLILAIIILGFYTYKKHLHNHGKKE